MQGTRPRKMKRELTIVGGFYREVCRIPASDEYFGSGGRAAAAIADMGIHTRLVTATDSSSAPILATLAQTFGFTLTTSSIPEVLRFAYEHPLKTPEITPDLGAKIQINVQNNCVLQFGMLEAETNIVAETVVFDPQDPVSPKPFAPSHGTKPRIAYVLNRIEATKLSGVKDIGKAAAAIAAQHKAAVVVVKLGALGALVYQDGKLASIPAFETDTVWPIGSGDVFAAVFAAKWALEDIDAVDAANQASRAAALYVSTRVLPVSNEAISRVDQFRAIQSSDNPFQADGYHAYLAAPFFNMSQLWIMEEARLALRGMGLKVFSPFHDVGIGAAHDVVPQDVEAIKKSRVMFAVVDGLDPGTVFEIGYARALGVPVVALAECTPEEPLKMITGTGCIVVKDFSSAIYRAAWKARA